MKHISLFKYLPVAALIFFVSFGIALSTNAASTWRPPTQSAPGGNVDTPVNTGRNFQEKLGALFLNTSLTDPFEIGLSVFGRAIFNGNVQIATGSPAAGKVLTALDSNGTVGWAVAAAGAVATTSTTGGTAIIGPLTDPAGTAAEHQVSFSLSSASDVLIIAYATAVSDSGGANYVRLVTDGAISRTAYYGEECGRYCSGGAATVVLSAKQSLSAGTHTLKVQTPGSRPSIYTDATGGGGVQFYVYVLTPEAGFSNGGGGVAAGVTSITAGPGISVSGSTGAVTVSATGGEATPPSGSWCGSYNYSRTGANLPVFTGTNRACKSSQNACPAGYSTFSYVSQGSGVPANPETGKLTCVKD